MCQVDRFLESNLRSGQVPPALRSLPLAEIFVLGGFYLIYSIEELTHFMVEKYAANTGLQGHSHHQAEGETMMAAEGGETGTVTDKSIHLRRSDSGRIVVHF